MRLPQSPSSVKSGEKDYLALLLNIAMGSKTEHLNFKTFVTKAFLQN